MARKLTRNFGGAVIDENDWHEDGDGEKGLRYGHRADGQFDGDIFGNVGPEHKITNAERETACSYRGRDWAGTDNKAAGVLVDISLDFKGQAFDRCTGTFGDINLWAVKFNGMVKR